MLMLLYWRRATGAGVLAGMIGGLVTVMLLYVGGWTDTLSRDAIQNEQRVGSGPAPKVVVARWLQDHCQWISGWGEKRPTKLAPLYVGGVDTLVWGFLASLVFGFGVSLCTRDEPGLVERYFPSAEPD
jgi:Na+/proline symporter